jgi:hypothetical protein
MYYNFLFCYFIMEIGQNLIIIVCFLYSAMIAIRVFNKKIPNMIRICSDLVASLLFGIGLYESIQGGYMVNSLYFTLAIGSLLVMYTIGDYDTKKNRLIYDSIIIGGLAMPLFSMPFKHFK